MDIGTDIPGSRDINPAPDQAGQFNDWFDSVKDDIQTSLIECEEFAGIDRQDINDQFDCDHHIKTMDEIRWLLFANPKILKSLGHKDLQDQIEKQMNDALEVVTTKHIRGQQ